MRKTNVQNLHLTGFSDASYANCPTTRKSTSGLLIYLGNSPIFWKSRQQSLVTLSSCEAELVALTDLALEIVHLRRLLAELGIPQVMPTTIYTDSQSAQALLLQAPGQQGKRSKHISVRYFKVREFITEGIISLKYIPTDSMLADGLTKALPYVPHARLFNTVCLGHELNTVTGTPFPITAAT